MVGCSAEFPLSLIPDASTPDAQVPEDGAPPPDSTVFLDGAADAEPDAVVPVCGNGVILAPEGCDDGNTLDGDGCSATCQVEIGWYCTGQPSLCETECGDGIVAGLEICDDGNTVGGDGCAATCTAVCTNGSSTDCNLAGQTLDQAAAFVDPDPPADATQCAGFQNTPGNDVGPHWDANCLGVDATIRIRLFDTSNTPWSLVADATLIPDADGTYTTQTFGAVNNGGSHGVLEVDGLVFLMDDPGGTTISSFACAGTLPGNRQYEATDLYFASQANDRMFVVSGNSESDDGAAIQTDDEELARIDRSFEQCGNGGLNRMTELAIAIFLAN